MKLRIVTQIIILALLILAGCGKKAEALKETRKIKVVLDWTPNTNHTGLYVAQQLGFFKEMGLEVEIIQPGQNTAEQIVASGHAQFGFSYQESVILARSEDIPLVSLAAVIQHNTSGFAALKSAGISRPRDFAGKRYGSSGWPSEKEIIRTIMAADSSSFDKVKVIDGVYDFFGTIGKDADFEWIFYGWDGIEAKRRNMDISYIPLRDLNPVFDYYTPVIITGEKMITADPELVKNFMDALARGYAYCIQNPRPAADVLIKAVPELAANSEQVYLSMDYLKNEYQADAPKWGLQKPEVWKNFADWMFSRRLINTGLKTESMFTNDFLP